MARNYIAEMEAAAKAIIPDLNISDSSIVKRILDVVAVTMNIIDEEIQNSEAIIEASPRLARITTAEYMLDVAYMYQEGDPVVIVNQATKELGYATIDSSKQIIKQANVASTQIGVVRINVATTDSNNNIVSLDQLQLDAFREYFANFTPIGLNVSIASNTPAVFDATNLYIRYHRTYNLTDIQTRIATALHDLQLVRRNSIYLYVNEIEAYLTNIEGVRDAYFLNPRLEDAEGTQTPENGRFDLNPGYFNFDPTLYTYPSAKTIFEAV